MTSPKLSNVDKYHKGVGFHEWPDSVWLRLDLLRYRKVRLLNFSERKECTGLYSELVLACFQSIFRIFVKLFWGVGIDLHAVQLFGPLFLFLFG